MVRLPSILPGALHPEQKTLYERNRKQIAEGFPSFKTVRHDGALLGPWGIFLHKPIVGQSHYDQIAAVTHLKRLPEAARQVAILVIGVRYGAACKLYADAAIASADGMDEAKVATIAAGNRPDDLTHDEAAAYDVVGRLAAGGVLPDATYRKALDQFGQGGLNELIFWVGIYAQVAITLNAFDVPTEQEYGS